MQRALDLLSELRALESRIKVRNDKLSQAGRPILDYQFTGDLSVTERIIRKTYPDELEIYQIPQLTNKINSARLALEKYPDDQMDWFIPVAVLGGIALLMLTN